MDSKEIRLEADRMMDIANSAVEDDFTKYLIYSNRALTFDMVAGTIERDLFNEKENIYLWRGLAAIAAINIAGLIFIGKRKRNGRSSDPGYEK